MPPVKVTFTVFLGNGITSDVNDGLEIENWEIFSTVFGSSLVRDEMIDDDILVSSEKNNGMLRVAFFVSFLHLYKK